MRPFKIKYGKRKEKGYLPNSWADVDFKTFIKFFDESVKGSIEGVFSVLTSTSKDIWSMPHKAELFANISNALSFTKLNPHCELPTHITYDDGPLRKVEKDFMNLPLGLYQDMLLMVQQIAGEEADEVEQLKVMPKIIAMFILKEYNDIEEINKAAEKIETMPADKIYTLGAFFLTKLEKLSVGMNKNTKEVDSLTTKVKLVFKRFLASLIICITFIIKPKVIYLTLKNYLKKLWVRCTGGDIYIVASPLPIRNMNKY